MKQEMDVGGTSPPTPLQVERGVCRGMGVTVFQVNVSFEEQMASPHLPPDVGWGIAKHARA